MSISQWSTTAIDNADAADNINLTDRAIPRTLQKSLRQAMADVAALRDTGVVGAVNTANSPNANEFARFTDADTIEGLTEAEFKVAANLEAADILAALLTVRSEER